MSAIGVMFIAQGAGGVVLGIAWRNWLLVSIGAGMVIGGLIGGAV